MQCIGYWPHRLAVRTSASHVGNTGSIPVGVASFRRARPASTGQRSFATERPSETPAVRRQFPLGSLLFRGETAHQANGHLRRNGLRRLEAVRRQFPLGWLVFGGEAPRSTDQRSFATERPSETRGRPAAIPFGLLVRRVAPHAALEFQTRLSCSFGIRHANMVQIVAGDASIATGSAQLARSEVDAAPTSPPSSFRAAVRKTTTQSPIRRSKPPFSRQNRSAFRTELARPVDWAAARRLSPPGTRAPGVKASCRERPPKCPLAPTTTAKRQGYG